MSPGKLSRLGQAVLALAAVLIFATWDQAEAAPFGIILPTESHLPIYSEVVGKNDPPDEVERRFAPEVAKEKPFLKSEVGFRDQPSVLARDERNKPNIILLCAGWEAGRAIFPVASFKRCRDDMGGRVPAIFEQIHYFNELARFPLQDGRFNKWLSNSQSGPMGGDEFLSPQTNLQKYKNALPNGDYGQHKCKEADRVFGDPVPKIGQWVVFSFIGFGVLIALFGWLRR